MRKIYGFLMLCLLACSLASCQKEHEEPYSSMPTDRIFSFDENGICYDPSVQPMSAAEFQQSVINYSWAPIKTHKIHANGYCSLKEPYVLDGGSYANYYFENESTVKEYFSIATYPPLSGFLRCTYRLDPTNNRIVGDYNMDMQVLSVSETEMEVIQRLGVSSQNKPMYSYTIFKRMSSQEFQEMEETHNTDFQELWGRYPQ